MPTLTSSLTRPLTQLENVDIVVADHVQRVLKPNFAASWDEIGDENQVEETFALSTMRDIPGEAQPSRVYSQPACLSLVCALVRIS